MIWNLRHHGTCVAGRGNVVQHDLVVVRLQPGHDAAQALYAEGSSEKVTNTPTYPVRLARSERFVRVGWYPSRPTADITRSRIATETLGLSLSTRDTVPMPTPALRSDIGEGWHWLEQYLGVPACQGSGTTSDHRYRTSG